ncbi:hypothetical protein MRX96_000089 [Rhipicephalus microplus]
MSAIIRARPSSIGSAPIGWVRYGGGMLPCQGGDCWGWTPCGITSFDRVSGNSSPTGDTLAQCSVFWGVRRLLWVFGGAGLWMPEKHGVLHLGPSWMTFAPLSANV